MGEEASDKSMEHFILLLDNGTVDDFMTLICDDSGHVWVMGTILYLPYCVHVHVRVPSVIDHAVLRGYCELANIIAVCTV